MLSCKSPLTLSFVCLGLSCPLHVSNSACFAGLHARKAFFAADTSHDKHEPIKAPCVFRETKKICFHACATYNDCLHRFHRPLQKCHSVFVRRP
ncbi:hypothetical protein HDV57DRAFT_38549 [Trichoderma longibrachiatum]|uniref:Secreted protein n=1 Tax=Trichoderma longibrachiatum ATCC 18648 TaxID=983965 RepID=A0A2T4CHL2_TRILO|nr:hypothetical protein M440DRAFT_75082 [Trichoderma longibrachiatum ATCC 18648]